MQDSIRITEEIDTLVMAYEKESGKPVSPLALRIVTYFYRLGIALADLGYKDAINGRKPLSLSVLCDLTRGALTGKRSAEAVQIYGDLMLENYMIGYSKGQQTE